MTFGMVVTLSGGITLLTPSPWVDPITVIGVTIAGVLLTINGFSGGTRLMGAALVVLSSTIVPTVLDLASQDYYVFGGVFAVAICVFGALFGLGLFIWGSW